MTALAETISSSDEVGLTSKNTSVGIVGLDQNFEVLEGAKLQPYVSFPSAIYSAVIDSIVQARWH